MSEHRPRKRFGQNFLHDTGVINRIIAAVAPTATDHFVEIGPGQGAITRALATQAGKLDVIEIDRDLAAELRDSEWFNAAKATLHVQDALTFDFATLADADRTLRMVGNLPYNISTPLLFHLLAHHRLFQDMHVMLQKEVVDRMTAAPGNKNYGRLTVALAARCSVTALFQIGSGAFKPAPRVASAFARLVPLATPLLETTEIECFDMLLRLAFGQRRKQLANALQTAMTAKEIAAAGIDPTARAEQLSVEDFVALTRGRLNSPTEC